MVCSTSNELTMNQEQFHRVIGLLKHEETNKERLEYILQYLKIDSIDLDCVTKMVF